MQNKILKFFFTIFTVLFLINAEALDKSIIKRVDLTKANETTSFSVDTADNTWAFFNNEITYLKDKSYVVPIIPWNKNTKKYDPNSIYYVLIDCKTPGVILYNKDLSSPVSTNDPNASGAMIKNCFCPTKLDGKRILWVHIWADNIGFNPYVLYIDEISSNGKVWQYSYSSLDRFKQTAVTMTNGSNFLSGSINCNENTIHDGIITKNYYDTDHDGHYLMDLICGRNNVLKNNNISLAKKTKSQDMGETCTNLGFSKGTENYENCILQLLDK